MQRINLNLGIGSRIPLATSRPGMALLWLRQWKLLKVFTSITGFAAQTFTVARENQPGNPGSTKPQNSGEIGLVSIFSTFQNCSTFLLSLPFFPSSVASESVQTLLKCLIALRRRELHFTLLILL